MKRCHLPDLCSPAVFIPSLPKCGTAPHSSVVLAEGALDPMAPTKLLNSARPNFMVIAAKAVSKIF